MSTMHCSVTWAEANNPARQGIQDFIAENFYEAYHADVNYFCDLLVGCEDHADHFIAAFGITQLKNHPAFLEQYLAHPIEEAISNHIHAPVDRDEIFELGNLAAIHPGATRKLIQKMAADLYSQGARWVVFTANNLVVNAFQRLQLNPIALIDADPSLLPNKGENWGSYYDEKPQVMFIEVPPPRPH